MSARPFLGAAAAVAMLAILVAGCHDETPLRLDDEQTLTVMEAGSDRQVPGQLGMTKPQFVKQVSSGDLWVIGLCSEDPLIPRFMVVGRGNANGVGNFEITKTMCLNPATGDATDGVAVLTAANGDELHMVFDGQGVSAAPPTTAFVYVVDGGTGRFVHAQGELRIRTVLTSQSTWTSSGTGWILYEASDRAGR